MSFIAKTAFSPRKWNNRNNDLQNITGLFGTVSDSTFTAADCSAGLACVKGAGITAGGYQMTAAANGKVDKIYFCNPTDVQRGKFGSNTWALGVETLGLGIPEGTKDTFTEGVVGETYAFGPGNFSTLPDMTTNKYVTISNGMLVGGANAPAAGDGYYFEFDSELGIDEFTESNYNAFKRYNLVLRKASEYVAPSPSV